MAPQITPGAAVIMTPESKAHVPLRFGTAERCIVPGRRNGVTLTAYFTAAELLDESNWRDNHVKDFCSVRWSEQWGVSQRRIKAGLLHLQEQGALDFVLRPFRPGFVQFAGRGTPGSLLHKNGQDEIFLMVLRGKLRQLAKQHKLDAEATGLFMLLAEHSDHQTGEIVGWTKTMISDYFRVGWRTLSKRLAELKKKGLIEYRSKRGGKCHLRVLVRDQLILKDAGVSLDSPSWPQGRRSRAKRAATELANYYGAGNQPVHQLTGVFLAAIKAGVNEKTLTERVIAQGSLNGAQVPSAVLLTRAKTQRDALIEAGAGPVRKAQRAQRRIDAEQQAAEIAKIEEEVRNGEMAWLDQVCPGTPSGKELGLSTLISARSNAVRVCFLDRVRELIAEFPDHNPTQIVLRYAADPKNFRIDHIAERDQQIHGPPGEVPRRVLV